MRKTVGDEKRSGSIISSGIILVVVSGTDANFERPEGASVVYWIGSAEPVNAEAYDMWWSV